MFNTLKNASVARKTGGFTLVELLVVIVVIGLLAAIAVPIFLSQSDKANDAALKSDLSNAARMLSVAEASGVTLPSSLPAGQVTDLGAAGTITPNANLTVSGSGTTLCVEGTSDSGDTWSADLANGLRNYDCSGNANGQSPLTLTYTDVNFTAGSNSEVLAPTVSGGEGTKTYSLTGILPASITFDSATGTFTGPGGTEWQTWSHVSAGGTGDDRGQSISVLADGSAIVTGSFNGTVTFGTSTLTSAGGSDVFVAKLDADGTWAWATKAGSTISDVALSVSVLADGSALVSGRFSNPSATFGSITLTSVASTEEGFVAKINSDGTWAWATGAGATNRASVNSVSALSDGSAIATGYFQGATAFGSVNLNNVGGLDSFIAKINSDGTWAWATGAGGTGTDIGNSVSALDDGSAIVAGRFAGAATFGSTSLTSAGTDEMFVAKVNANGTWAWVQQSGSTSFAEGKGVSALADGSAIVTGNFAGTATFGSANLDSGDTTGDVFVAKVSANGAWVWATRAGGTAVWDTSRRIATSSDGSAIVTGEYRGPATFGSTSLPHVDGFDMFIAKVNADGNWGWAVGTGGTSFDIGNSVSILADGSAVVTGYFRTSLPLGSTTLNSAGSNDIFVAKVQADGTWDIGNPTLSGLPVTVDVTVTDSTGSTTESVTLAVD